MKAQLKELTTNSMLIAMFPIERHSKHLLVDSCRNCLCGTKLFSNEDDQNTTQKSPGRNEFIIIMKITIESPQKMSIRDLEESLMSRKESHDGLLCKICHLHSLTRPPKKP